MFQEYTEHKKPQTTDYNILFTEKLKIGRIVMIKTNIYILTSNFIN